MSVEIVRLLEAVIAAKGSDLHLQAGERPMVRLNGRLRPLQAPVLGGEDTQSLMRSITSDRGQASLSEKGSVDFSFELENRARFRVSVTRVRGSLKLVLRRLPHKLLTAAEIPIPQAIQRLARSPRGLLLVTGATGSGKSTSLAALAVLLAELDGAHIITVEEPMEYALPNGRGLVAQREVPTDTPSFLQGIVDALRMDPNVLIVGEMRDLATMRAALTAAETGHLVMATLHTNTAASTVARIIDGFPESEKAEVRAKLSMSLLGVLCQALLPRADDSGMVAAFEVMVSNPAMQHMIRDGSAHRIPSVIQTSAKHGMQLLDEHLYQLVAKRIVTPDAALIVSSAPDELNRRLKTLEDEDK